MRRVFFCLTTRWIYLPISHWQSGTDQAHYLRDKLRERLNKDTDQVGRVAFALYWHDVQILVQETWAYASQVSYLRT
jgi:hypothetical protein